MTLAMVCVFPVPGGPWTVTPAAFSKREMRWWRTEIVEPIVDRLLDELAPRGRADLYADFAAFIPASPAMIELRPPATYA